MRYKTLPFPHDGHLLDRGDIQALRRQNPVPPAGLWTLFALKNESTGLNRQSILRSLTMASFYLIGLYVIQWLLLVPFTESRNVVVRKEGDAVRISQRAKAKS